MSMIRHLLATVAVWNEFNSSWKRIEKSWAIFGWGEGTSYSHFIIPNQLSYSWWIFAICKHCEIVYFAILAKEIWTLATSVKLIFSPWIMQMIFASEPNQLSLVFDRIEFSWKTWIIWDNEMWILHSWGLILKLEPINQGSNPKNRTWRNPNRHTTQVQCH